MSEKWFSNKVLDLQLHRAYRLRFTTGSRVRLRIFRLNILMSVRSWMISCHGTPQIKKTPQPIKATLFLLFLNQNHALFIDDEKLIEDHALAALTILIAESRAEEKETMISVVLNCMVHVWSVVCAAICDTPRPRVRYNWLSIDILITLSYASTVNRIKT